MKQKKIAKMELPLYTMEELDRMLNASKVLDLNGEELLRAALDEFLKSRNL